MQVALGHASKGHFEVFHADRLERAIEELEAGSYDAMLLDLRLPDSDRNSTIDAAGTLAHRLPVIVLTGTEDPDLEIRASQVGAEEYLIKDRLDRAELPATILRAIRRHRRLGSGGVDPVICRIPKA